MSPGGAAPPRDPAGPAGPAAAAHPHPGAPPSGDVLVIGFGNDLRGDDAAGRLVAARLQDRAPAAAVRVRSVFQLVPELALELAGCTRVVFVDADRNARQVSARPIAADGPAEALVHRLTPAGLLALARTVGVEPPQALLVTVPAPALELGTQLSAPAAAGVDAATELVAELVAEPGDRAG